MVRLKHLVKYYKEAFWPKEFHWENYRQVLDILPFNTYLFNSFYTSFLITIYVLVSSALFAYMLAFYKFKGKNITFSVVMATYMIPGAVSYVPVYVMLGNSVSLIRILDT